MLLCQFDDYARTKPSTADGDAGRQNDHDTECEIDLEIVKQIFHRHARTSVIELTERQLSCRE